MDEIYQHLVKEHSDPCDLCKKLTIRINNKFDCQSGFVKFDIIEFKAKIEDIQSAYKKGYAIHLDFDTPRVTCKRPLDTSISDSNKSSNVENNQNSDDSQVDDYYYNFFHQCIKQMELINRKEDFLSLIKTVASGDLNYNVGWHFSLDLGRFHGLSDIRKMEFENLTLDFWVAFKQVNKTKGLNFSRGYKGEGMGREGQIKPKDCRINLVVPSDKTIQRACQQYRQNITPGIITDTIDMFAEKHKGKDIKVSMDGKMCTYINMSSITLFVIVTLITLKHT